MDQDLKKLRQRLRAERCPDAVLERVYAQTSTRQRSLLRAYGAWAIAALLAVSALSLPLSRWAQKQPDTSVRTASIEEMEAKAIRQQASVALAYLGKRLTTASAHSGEIILESSLPSLRKGLRTARESITIPNHIKTDAN